MKIIILAAGVGSRLMPLTRNTPKSLLDIGQGYSLLERQLQSIGEAGIRDVYLVTGYKSEQIEAKVKDYTDFNINIIYNPFYRMANNLPSAWMGLKDFNEPVILVNGDDIFQPSVVSNLMKSQEDITMVISRKGDYDEDDMKVSTLGKVVTDVGKDLDLEVTNGESIGMILFQGRGLYNMQQTLLDMVRREENLQLFYLAALRRMMREGHRVHFSECSRDDWAEVDFHPDLEQMRDFMKIDISVKN